MPKRFGTDGIRGVANADLGCELALDLGRAVAVACREGILGDASTRPRVVVGRDTRPSGEMLESAVVAGLCSAGADVLRAGILPTPGVAFLAADLGASAGVVVSASHNPAPDNGFKVFGPQGWKLTEAAESAIEELMAKPHTLPTGVDVGRAAEVLDAEERYLEHLAPAGLAGIRVVVDCAHGSAYRVAPRALERAGAEVIPLHSTPEGERINAGCGATHPGTVAAIAKREGAIGLALDGDADRVLASDEYGAGVDGDAIIALLASRMRERGELVEDAVVVTVMANQALRTWAAGENIRLVETPVGDRYVLEAMRERNIALGGEQSGHIVRLDRATTGDGVLTALGLLECVVERGGSLAACVPFRPLPQVLVNVRTAGALGETDAIREAIDEAQRELGSAGRVLVRPSGTEPLVRVMVEAATRELAGNVANRLAAAVERELGR